MAFGYQDLLRAYRSIGVDGQGVVALNTDLRWLGLTCPPKTDPVAMLGFGSRTVD